MKGTAGQNAKNTLKTGRETVKVAEVKVNTLANFLTKRTSHEKFLLRPYFNRRLRLYCTLLFSPKFFAWKSRPTFERRYNQIFKGQREMRKNSFEEITFCIRSLSVVTVTEDPRGQFDTVLVQTEGERVIKSFLEG